MYSAWIPPVVTMTSSGAPTGIPLTRRSFADEQIQQLRNAGGLNVMSVVVVDGAVHRALDRLGRVETHVPLIEAERILDGVHHVANPDDAGERHRVEKVGHEESIVCCSLLAARWS